MRELIIIAALSENYVIGNNNKIPWNIPEDMKRFKELTSGHLLLMGRKSHESILTYTKGNPLPNRTHIVLSRTAQYNHGRVITCRTLDEALEISGDQKLFIVGGQTIYEQTIDIADRMELTHVGGIYKGDAFFPRFDRTQWEVTKKDMREGHEFVTYTRK